MRRTTRPGRCWGRPGPRSSGHGRSARRRSSEGLRGGARGGGKRLVLVVRRRLHHRERTRVRRALPPQRGTGLPPHRHAPPERLARPIIAPYKDKSQAGAISLVPRRLIRPLIDGTRAAISSGTERGSTGPEGQAEARCTKASGAFSQLWYGFSLTDLYVRLDPHTGRITSASCGS